MKDLTRVDPLRICNEIMVAAVTALAASYTILVNTDLPVAVPLTTAALTFTAIGGLLHVLRPADAYR